MRISKGFHISYLFKPVGTLLICLLIICLAAVIGECVEVISDGCSSSIALAIITGLIASAVVAALLQMGENHRYNIERSNELYEFYIAFKFYNHLIAGHIESERRRQEADDLLDGLHGKLNATWRELDSVISLLRKCKEQKQRFLTLSEIQAMDKVFNAYAWIKRTIRTVVLMKMDRSVIPEYRLNMTLAEAAKRLRKLEGIKHSEDLIVKDAVKNPDAAYHLLGIYVEDTMIVNRLSDSGCDIAVCASYEIAEYLDSIQQELIALNSLISKDMVLRRYGKRADKQYLHYQRKQEKSR